MHWDRALNCKNFIISMQWCHQSYRNAHPAWSSRCPSWKRVPPRGGLRGWQTGGFFDFKGFCWANMQRSAGCDGDVPEVWWPALVMFQTSEEGQPQEYHNNDGIGYKPWYCKYNNYRIYIRGTVCDLRPWCCYDCWLRSSARSKCSYQLKGWEP